MAPQLPWLQMLEQMAVQQLLKSPTWNRAVETVVKRVNRARYGESPDDMGGTRLDAPGDSFGQHFTKELQNQLWKVEKMEQKALQDNVARKSSQPPSNEHVESADAAWKHIQEQEQGEQPSHQGFMSDYAAALRGQIKQKRPPG